MHTALARSALAGTSVLLAGCILFPAPAPPRPTPLSAAERSAVGCYEITAPQLFRRRSDPRLRFELDSEEITQRVLVGHTPYTWRAAWMDGLGFGRYRLVGDTLTITFGVPDVSGLTFLVGPLSDSTGVATIHAWMTFNPAFDRKLPVVVRRASCESLFGT